MSKYIGVMSGTSLDGVDAVLVSIKNDNVEVIKSVSHDFPSDLVNDLKRLLEEGIISLQKLGEINYRLGLVYANCVNDLILKAGINSDEVTAIGCHGQTVFHDPRSKYPFSMQLGDGNVLAVKTGVDAIMDFRGMDIAFGGEGAPLTPAFHQEFFKEQNENRVILNLGGIANVTVLNEDKILGFDTGPANCLIDLWIQNELGKQFDKNGDWARSGNIHSELLTHFMNEDYFKLKAPKSTGKELFNLEWIKEKLVDFPNISNKDVQATITELTARSIAEAIHLYASNIDAMYICGGGAFNLYLRERLSHYMPKIKISTTSDLGIPEQLVEAVAFAWLAHQRVNELSGNLPSVTGSGNTAILGCVYKYIG